MMTETTSLFADPMAQKRPWQSFALSYALQAAMVVVLVRVAVSAPKILEQRPYQSASLYTPKPETPKTTPLGPLPRLQPPPPATMARLQPKIETPPLAPAPAPAVVVAKADTLPAAPLKIEPRPEPGVETGKFEQTTPLPKPAGNPNKEVETGKFSGSSATPTVKADISKVQTGGFGDPNGVPAQESPNKGGAQIARVGSFDLPQGAGQGNGAGANKGLKGTVASAGFGPGMAGPGNGDHNGGGRYAVRQAGFGDAQPTVAEAHPRPKTVETPATPVEVLEKPKPIYTDEARKLRIEGEVLLEVVFSASGRLQVVRVVRGLGHGLDEAAVSAAQKIHYKPAMREGKPVDSTATLHIMFQVA